MAGRLQEAEQSVMARGDGVQAAAVESWSLQLCRGLRMHHYVPHDAYGSDFCSALLGFSQASLVSYRALAQGRGSKSKCIVAVVKEAAETQPCLDRCVAGAEADLELLSNWPDFFCLPSAAKTCNQAHTILHRVLSDADPSPLEGQAPSIATTSASSPSLLLQLRARASID